MGSLTSSLLTASSAMDAMEQAMSVIQNNVVNASTPGYVTETLTLKAKSFDPSQNIWGGVESGGVISSRNEYAEENVWNQNTLLGAATQQSAGLSALQNIFGISAQSGIPSALTSLYSAFSAWSAKPTDVNAQQQVLSSAQGIAQAFNQAATAAQQLEQQTGGQLQSTVDQINQLTSQIASYNGQIRTGSANDGGVQTQLYNALETLSGLANIQVQHESDGTVGVLMNGQVPLVLGTTQQQLSVAYPAPQSPTYPGATPNAQILSGSGTDVTAQVTGGQLGGLLQFRNTTLPSIIGNGSQQGSLNQLAQTFADRVNQLLGSGQTASGAAGSALFSYSSTAPTSIAATFAENSSLAGSDLAAVDPGPPAVVNGIASHLAALSSPTNSTDMVNGQSYTDFYGSIAAQIGNQASTASSNQSTQSDQLAQAQNLRAQVSGVSLNDQAATLMQFQQAYEAAAQMISVINTTTQYLMNSIANI
jgi:flagellar hook-associated protein 1 FlgK